MRARLLIPALAALGLATVATVAVGAAPAGADPGPMPAADRRHDGTPLTLDDAVELVKRRYDARVVRAEESREGEELVYKIRLLAEDGRVFTVRVNARTGSVE